MPPATVAPDPAESRNVAARLGAQHGKQRLEIRRHRGFKGQRLAAQWMIEGQAPRM
jgi:hypothetical protein